MEKNQIIFDNVYCLFNLFLIQFLFFFYLIIETKTNEN